MSLKSLLAAAVALILAISGTASAHTISIGTYNAGVPGSVTLAMGTYSHGGGIFQGAMSLIAGPMTTGPVSFTSFTNTKPAALVDGVSNFYIDTSSSSADAFTQAINSIGFAPTDWQEVTFSGLLAGVYTYQLSGMNSSNWSNWNTGTNNWTGTLVVTNAVANGVPEPASLALLGMGFVGLVAAGRRRRI